MTSLSIAVIISHYEQHVQLNQCLKSIACQVREADQVIVVDDGSNQPPTKDYLNKTCSSPVTLVLNHQNCGGPAIPRNKAISACQCSHLVLLDADDILLPYTLQALESTWITHPSAIACGDQICWGDKMSNPFLQNALSFEKLFSSESKCLYERLLSSGNRLFLSGSGGPTKTFVDNGFDSEQRWEDYDLWLRLAKLGHLFLHTGSIHTMYRLQKGSRSGSRKARQNGCQGIRRKHLNNRPWWNLPLWYWKQRFL